MGHTSQEINYFAPPRLDTLPPELLLQIFAIPDLELTRIDICHRLLAKLQDAITRRPQDGKLIKRLYMSYYRPSESERESRRSGAEFSYTTDAASDEASELLGGLSLEASNGPEDASAKGKALDVKRLASFFAALPNLEELAPMGKQLLEGLLDPAFAATHPMAKLRNLKLFVRPDEVLDSIDDAAFFAHASRLPLLAIHLYDALEVPVDEAEYEDEDDPEDWPLRPRSWNLDELEFQRLASLGPGAPFLFQSLSALTKLVIFAAQVEPDFSDYFTHLPPTLVVLRLRIGSPHATPLERSTAPTLAPFLATAATAFPKLEVLDLGGTIVSRELLASLHHLPAVKCLHLQHGASLFLPSLLALVQRDGRHQMRSLAHLAVRVCHCPAGAKEGAGADARARWVPNWSPTTGFARAKARALVRACRNAVSNTTGGAIRIDGAILCALKECGRGSDPLHVCEREGVVSEV